MAAYLDQTKVCCWASKLEYHWELTMAYYWAVRSALPIAAPMDYLMADSMVFQIYVVLATATESQTVTLTGTQMVMC